MPPQIHSDQAYPERSRWNEPRGDETKTQPHNGRKPGPVPFSAWRPAAEQANAWQSAPEPSNERGPAPEPQRPPMSRRSILRGVAGVGAVAGAAAVGAGAVVAFDKPSSATETLMPVAKPVVMAPMAPTAMEGPLVVYISDTTSGLLDVYGGTGATQVKNPALVRQLLANLKLA